MAGGTIALDVTCMVCLSEGQLTRATRYEEGNESDQYRCERGHEFGMDWPTPAVTPMWPPPPELMALLNKR